MSLLARGSRLGRRAFSFALIPAISLVTPLLVIPVISRAYSAPGILAVSVGQSAGAVGGIIVALGWPLVGSAMVAQAKVDQRAEIYRRSLNTRGLALLLVVPGAAASAWLLVDNFKLAAALTAVNFSCYGLTSVWYYVGTGRASGLIINEIVPRIAASVIAAISLLCGAPLEVYPILLLSAVALAWSLNAKSLIGHLPGLEVRAGYRGIIEQLGPTAARTLNAFYNGGTTSLVAAFAPSAALLFAAVDRTQKSAFNCCTTAPESMISWVVGVPEGRSRRVSIALSADLLFSIFCGLFFFAAFPLVLRFLYSDVVQASGEVRLLSAIAVSSLICSRAYVTHGLLAWGLERFASILLASASVAGVALVVVGAVWRGVTGAIVGVIVSEAVCVAVVAGKVVLGSRRGRAGGI